MNYNTRELIKLYSKCTGNTNRQEIMKILGASPIFEEVKKGTNDCLNYEGYISNLLDIVDDIKSQGNYSPEIDCVCPDTIAMILVDEGIRGHWCRRILVDRLASPRW